MHKITEIARREIIFLLKTRPVLLVLLVAPLMYPFMYNAIYIHKYATKTPLAIVDLDKTPASRELIAEMNATQLVAVVDISDNMESVRTFIESGKATGVIVIADSYERKLKRCERPVVRAYFNATRFMNATDAGKGLSEAIVHLGKNILVEKFTQTGVSLGAARAMAQPLELQSENIANTQESYGDFIIPALLLLILQQSLFVGTATASAGIGKRKYRKLPKDGIITGIVGRSIPYFCLYGLYSALFFTVHYAIWKIPFSGNMILLAAFTFIDLAIIIGAGFLMGSLCNSRLTALLIGMFSSYPIFLLSGLAWPKESMPHAIQIIALGFPSTHYFPTALAIARMGAGWTEIQGQFFSLVLIFAAVLTALLFRMASIEWKTKPDKGASLISMGNPNL